MRARQKDAGVLAPLLPETQSPEDQRFEDASISGAIFNMSTGMIGAGIMSIPATFKVLGIIPGFLVILVVAFFVEVTVEFLLRYTRSGESSTYAGLMAESFGKFGSVGLQICVMITNLGALIIYLIIIGDVLSGNQSDGSVHLGILQEWFGIHRWNSRAYSLLFVVLFVMLPLLLLRRVDSLRHASAISILLAVVFVVICSGMALYAMWEGKTQRLRLVPDFANGVSFFDLFTTIPVFATGFGCHVNGFIYAAAIAIPNIWYFFQFMGTTTVVCLMFIFPSSIILRDVHRISTTRDKFMAILVIILAVGTSVVAIFSNIYSYIDKNDQVL
ncbi:unnamed protein product [Ilex paraguariensis]|uniref:Amino acid transporter transmembrane domain-containing protein n=1 Tax=Ilex paraguariensis TaxID=185542 RepID=A0ABC8QSY8_9AQUA